MWPIDQAGPDARAASASLASPKLLELPFVLVLARGAAQGRVAAIWKQFGAIIGSWPSR